MKLLQLATHEGGGGGGGEYTITAVQQADRANKERGVGLDSELFGPLSCCKSQ